MSEAAVRILAADAQQIAHETNFKDRDRAADREKGQAEFRRRLALLKESVPETWLRRIEKTPAKHIAQRLRAHTGEASPREAIKAKCKECVGYEDLKVQVGGCQSFSCPIWAYRPFQD